MSYFFDVVTEYTTDTYQCQNEEFVLYHRLFVQVVTDHEHHLHKSELSAYLK